jgi:hypothetical protein
MPIFHQKKNIPSLHIILRNNSICVKTLTKLPDLTVFSCRFRKTIFTLLILTAQQGCKCLDMYGFGASPQNMLKRILVRPFSYCVKFELPGPSVRFFPARHKLSVYKVSSWCSYSIRNLFSGIFPLHFFHVYVSENLECYICKVI